MALLCPCHASAGSGHTNYTLCISTSSDLSRWHGLMDTWKLHRPVIQDILFSTDRNWFDAELCLHRPIKWLLLVRHKTRCPRLCTNISIHFTSNSFAQAQEKQEAQLLLWQPIVLRAKTTVLGPTQYCCFSRSYSWTQYTIGCIAAMALKVWGSVHIWTSPLP